MRVVCDLKQLSVFPQRTVLTIGNFDGVHLGHREIFRHVVRLAKQIAGTSAVLTFEPHPLRLLKPESAPPRINTPEEKIRLIEASCIDLLVVLEFTHKIASMPPEKFVQDILIKRFAIERLVVGYDYAFGKNREGNIDFLRQQARQKGFALDVLEPIKAQETVYSSTAIRQALLTGKVSEVVAVLGRNFTLDGKVIHGAGRGYDLGFPTANLVTEKELLPAQGVYAVKVKWQESYYDGVANIGLRPTFQASAPSIEVHLLDFTGKLYHENLRIYFVERLRDEQRFSTVASLKKAIKQDIMHARKILSNAQIVVYREYLDCGIAGNKGC